MKILIKDCETMPMLSYHWKRWKETITLPQTVHEGYLASWAAAWHTPGEVIHPSDIMYDGLDNYNMAMTDEAAVAASLWKLMDEADVLVHFNGDRFDIPVVKTAFAKYGFGPPSPFKSVDLFKQVKKHFRLSSNSLKSACKFFGVEQKLDNSGWQLWIDTVNKDPDAWVKMQAYNKQDIIATQSLYNHILPFITGHPNHALYNDSEAVQCNNCGSENIYSPSGTVFLKAGTYKRYKCKDCGAHFRGKTMTNLKSKRDSLLVAV